MSSTRIDSRWEGWPLVISLAALAVSIIAIIFTIYYNEQHLDNATESLKRSQRALDQSKRALAFQLYTNSNDSAERAFHRFARRTDIATFANGAVPEAREPELRDMLRRLDNMAFLFNRGLLSVPRARTRWRPAMRCMWYVAAAHRSSELYAVEKNSSLLKPGELPPPAVGEQTQKRASAELRHLYPELAGFIDPPKPDLNDCANIQGLGEELFP